MNPYIAARDAAFISPPSSVEPAGLYAWLTAMAASYSSGYVQGSTGTDPTDYAVRQLRAQLGDDNQFVTYVRQQLSR